MTNVIKKLQAAQKYAMANRPTVGGFPFLAECMRQAGVKKNLWSLPGAQSIYKMEDRNVVQQQAPLFSGIEEVAVFNQEALITALRTDQAGKSTFPEFLTACWKAGVVRYVADFTSRVVTYYGVNDEKYEESYPHVEIGSINFEE